MNKEDPGYIKIKRSEIFMGTLVDSLFNFAVAGTRTLIFFVYRIFKKKSISVLILFKKDWLVEKL